MLDTVAHSILLRSLKHVIMIKGRRLGWFRSYLSIECTAPWWFPLHIVEFTLVYRHYSQLANHILGEAISYEITFKNYSKTVKYKWLQYSDL